MADYTLRIRRFSPENGRGAVLAGLRRRSRRAPLGARRDPAGQGPRGRLDRHPLLVPRRDLRLLRRAHQRPPQPGLPHAPRQGRGDGARRRHRRRADGQHARAQGPDRRHGRGALEEDPARHAVAHPRRRRARARVHRAAGVDDRRHAVDGLHPVRRLCLRLPVDGGRPAVHRARGAGQGVSLRRRPARRPAVPAAQGPVGGSARDLRLHALLQLHRGLPQGRRADEPDHAAAPDRRRRPRDQRPQQRPPAREGVRQERREERPAARGRPPAGLLRRQVPPARRPRAGPLAAGHPHRAAARQGDAEEGPAARAQGPARGQARCSSTCTTSPSATSSTSTSWARKRTPARPRCTPTRPAAICRRRGARTSEGRLLARLREPRLHTGAARLDGQGRAAARHRARRARPRELLRGGRDRRAQPGARRHAQRAHLRARPAGRGRRADDEHLLHLPGRAVGVPGAARREHGVPRPRQRDAQRRGADLRARAHEQAPAVADGRGDRPRHGRGEGRAPAHRSARRPVLRLLHRPPDGPPRASTASTRATRTCTS